MKNITLVLSSLQIPKYFEEELKQMGNLKLIEATKLTEEKAVELLQGTEILICGNSGFEFISKTIFDGVKTLKLISIFGVGTDWIDVEEAEKRNIKIALTIGANSQAVAEHIWGMILNLSKRISKSARERREKGIEAFKKFKGRNVFGKTIGIIGYGNIGRKVAEIAKVFDMKILVNTRKSQNVEGINFVSKEELLQESDIIVLSLSSDKETKNIIDFQDVEKMKNGVIVVNCAREKLVNKKAILEGIASGKVYGYGLDETDIVKDWRENEDYLKYPNVLITPYNAYDTEETSENYYKIILENVRSFLDGERKNTF